MLICNRMYLMVNFSTELTGMLYCTIISMINRRLWMNVFAKAESIILFHRLKSAWPPTQNLSLIVIKLSYSRLIDEMGVRRK